MSLEGSQLGHYRITQFLKGGGMGEVYLAEDLALPRQVAIKVMKTEEALYPNSQTAQEAARLFQREMRAIAMLDHPNILTLHEAGEQNINREQVTYMVMPYCPAGSLADWIKQYHSASLLSPQEVAQLLTQAAEALQHAHDQRILHLDIKPQNFLVRRQQDPAVLPNLLLADFGVAKIANSTKMSGTPRGTYFYMAPEQLANHPVPASDQYALAIMTYELLTGRTPFEGALPQVIFYQHSQVPPDPPSTVNSSLPQVLDPVLLRALAKKPEERFASVREFSQAFAAALRPGASRPKQASGGYVGVTQTAQEQWGQQAAPPICPRCGTQTISQQKFCPKCGLNMSDELPMQPRQQAVPPRSPQYQQAAPPQRQQVASQPSQRSKKGFWWSLLFGVVAGGVDFLTERYLAYSLSLVQILIIMCLIVIIAGFMTGRIVLRKRMGTLTGLIAGITFVVWPLFVYHGSFYWLFSLETGIIMAVATLSGFVGGWLGTIGRARRQK
jgi:serine/threonine protein kinase